MAAAAREPLSGADSAWWRMDRPDNPMVITAVLTFDERVGFDRLRRAIETRLLTRPRFRHRVATARRPWSRLYWEAAPDFSLDDHLGRVALPAPGDEGALQRLVGTLMSRPLDYGRPPWRFDLVEEYGAGSAIVARLHHSIADGLALLHVLLSLDDIPGNEGSVALGPATRVMRPVAPPASGGALAAVGAGARVGAQSVAALARLLLGRSDPRSPLRGGLGREKRAVWSRPFPLETLREVAHARQAKLHDLMAAAVAASLGGWLRARAPRSVGRAVHAVVPVNLRSAAEWGELGNRFGLVFLRMPVWEGDALGRLRQTKAAMDALKHCPEAALLFLALRIFGRLGDPLLGLAVRILSRRSSLVLTDVPGPREPIWICGARLRDLIAWVPESGQLGLGVSVLSYAGEVRLGMVADAHLGEAPSELVAGAERELSRLIGPHGSAAEEALLAANLH